MCLNRKGFSILFVIFLLIVFSIMGLALIVMLTTSSKISAEYLLSTQAFYLAQSGAEIRIMQAIKGDKSKSKSYFFADNNKFKIFTEMHNIGKLPDGKNLYLIESQGNIMNLKREIKIKFIYY